MRLKYNALLFALSLIAWMTVTAFISFGITENFGLLWALQIGLGFLVGLTAILLLARRIKIHSLCAASIFSALSTFVPSRPIFELILGNKMYKSMISVNDIGLNAFIKFSALGVAKILLYSCVSMVACFAFKMVKERVDSKTRSHT